ncbi:MAG: hypothetical protein U0W24_05775 [Bacteroidales bacterium]
MSYFALKYHVMAIPVCSLVNIGGHGIQELHFTIPFKVMESGGGL